VVEVDVYETHSLLGVDITAGYTIGALLYVSQRGLITNTLEATKSTDKVGKVVKVPTTADVRLGLKVNSGTM
jgi:hypothetical protein